MLQTIVKGANNTITICTQYKTVCNSVKITSKHKQIAQIETERVFNAIATKCDKPKNNFIKKIKALK